MLISTAVNLKVGYYRTGKISSKSQLCLFSTTILPEKHCVVFYSCYILNRGGEQKVLKEMEDYIAFPWHKALKQAW